MPLLIPPRHDWHRGPITDESCLYLPVLTMAQYNCCESSGCKVTAGLPPQLCNPLCILDTLSPYLLEEEMPFKINKQKEGKNPADCLYQPKGHKEKQSAFKVEAEKKQNFISKWGQSQGYEKD